MTGAHAGPPRSAPVMQRVAHWLKRRLVPLVVGVAALGVAFPTGGRYVTGVHGIPVTIAVLVATTGVALTTGQLRASRTATARLLGVLVITSVALPALAWGASQLTDPGPLRQGVLAAGVAPAEVASVALVDLGGGEAALTAALLIGSTLVTVLAAGPILSILGSAATVSSTTLLIQLLLVVALPLTAGITTRHALRPNAAVPSASTALGTLALLTLLWQVASQITLKPSYVSLTLAVLRLPRRQRRPRLATHHQTHPTAQARPDPSRGHAGLRRRRRHRHRRVQPRRCGTSWYLRPARPARRRPHRPTRTHHPIIRELSTGHRRARLPLAPWRLRPTYRPEAVVLTALTRAAVLARRLSANISRLNNDGVAADDPATGAPLHSSMASSAATPISAHPATTAASLTSAPTKCAADLTLPGPQS